MCDEMIENEWVFLLKKSAQKALLLVLFKVHHSWSRDTAISAQKLEEIQLLSS